MDSDSAPISAAESSPSTTTEASTPASPRSSRGVWLKILGAVAVTAVLVAAFGAYRFYQRYEISDEITLPIVNVDSAMNDAAPEDRAAEYGRYPRHRLRLIKRGHSTLDFILESDDPKTAQIALKGVDASLFVPRAPQWAQGDPDLERVAIAGREAQRQQVAFNRGSDALKIIGGDGVERDHLKTAEIANHSESAGYWEILLFLDGPDGKKLYYQGAFDFPLGRYQAIFEHSTGLSYWSHWKTLEGWSAPDGTLVPLDRIREVRAERDAAFTIAEESAPLKGKLKEIKARETRAAAIPTSETEAASPPPAQELEFDLRFSDGGVGSPTRLVIGGINREALPSLPADQGSKGLTVPLGIAVPPFSQTYEDLHKQRPETIRRYALWLDSQDRWIDPRAAGAIGAVLSRDAGDPSKLNLYLLSPERHSLILRVSIDLGADAGPAPPAPTP